MERSQIPAPQPVCRLCEHPADKHGWSGCLEHPCMCTLDKAQAYLTDIQLTDWQETVKLYTEGRSNPKQEPT